MHNEQIFTPEHVVDTMFEELEYKGDKIRKKHVIDNSCGNGAILKMVVRTYIHACIMCGLSKEETINELEAYIHGIEIDESLYNQTIENLDKVAEEYSLYNVKWDIIHGDAMLIKTFDNMMDYVFGNPPYCNVHHISQEKYEIVKSYNFANGGMTDMYLVFFEIGINMLNENGKLSYITPNSWLTSTAGNNFRKYLENTKTLLEIYQYGNYKVFKNANTYTCITFLSKKPKTNNVFVCYKNTSECYRNMTQTIENLEDCMIDGKIYLTDKHTLEVLRQINQINKKIKNKLKAKNGFATLNDEFFIIDDYPNKNEDKNVLFVTKASNGHKHYFFYPYDENGKPMQLEYMNKDLTDFMRSKALKMDIDTNVPNWYLYGRTQALNDVKYDKIIVNNLIRNVNDIKIETLQNTRQKQQGVYSGYYIAITEDYQPFVNQIIYSLKNENFVQYVKSVGKYKNGGYYTFSSKELESWINFFIHSDIYKR